MKIFLFMLFLPLNLSADPLMVSLHDAFLSAVEKTETASLSQARVEQTEAKTDQVFAKFLPNLSIGANYLQQDTKGVRGSGAAILGGRQSYSRVTLSQSIFEGGRDYFSYKVTKSDQEVQRQNLIVANYNTFLNVARSFYAILSGEREVDNIKKTIALGNERLNEISNRTKIGRSRQVEVIAARAQISVLQAQQMAAEGQLITAWDQFVLLTGLPRDIKLNELKERPEIPEDLSLYLSSLDKRPDIAAIEAQIESTQGSISVARAGHFPSLTFNSNLYISREGPQRGNNWDFSATLNFPLFAGGLVSAQVQEASKKNTEARLLLGQMKRQGEMSIRTAFNNLQSALNQLKALESALTSTEQNYREQEKNYRFGQATNLDVIQALNSFQDTKRTFDRTRFMALSAWAELKAATAQVEQVPTSASQKGEP